MPGKSLSDRMRAEVDAFNDVIEYGFANGPLAAYRQVTAGTLGGPIVRAAWGLFGLGSGSLLSTRLGFLVSAATFPILLVGLGLWATEEAMRSSPVVAAMLYGAVLIVAVVGTGLLFGVAWKRTRAAITTTVAPWSIADLVVIGGFVVLAPAVLAACLSVIFVQAGSVTVAVQGWPELSLPYQAFETFIWHLANAVPVLKVTETLAWTASLEFQDLPGRCLVLLYKVVAIFPFVQLAGMVVAQEFGKRETKSSSTGRSSDEDAA